jgi:uracil-DNA glycosylase family 4
MRYIVKDFKDCKRCPLHRFRKTIVFGRGSLPADLLLVGEGPGKVEDALGLPFVGPSGRILNDAIKVATMLARLVWAPSMYISNIVSCRPTDIAGGENRAPTGEEAWACWPRLRQTYQDVNPRKVILLGQIAQKYGRQAWPDAVCLPHPAYLLRVGGQENPMFRAFCRDLSAVFEEVARARVKEERSTGCVPDRSHRLKVQPI